MGFKLGRENRDIKNSSNVKKFNEGRKSGNFRGSPIVVTPQEHGTLAEAQIDAGTRKDIAAENAASSAGSAIGNLIATLGTAFIRWG